LQKKPCRLAKASRQSAISPGHDGLRPTISAVFESGEQSIHSTENRDDMTKTMLTWLSGIAAAVISGLVIWWLTTEHPRPLPPGAKAGLFAGSWVNENSGTNGITRVDIHQRLNKLFVHTWGKCVPTDCDEGEQTVDVVESDKGILSMKITLPFASEVQEVAVLPDSRLRLVRHTHFTDGSKRPDYDASDYFKKK
jgi:hypothetical protein